MYLRNAFPRSFSSSTDEAMPSLVPYQIPRRCACNIQYETRTFPYPDCLLGFPLVQRLNVLCFSRLILIFEMLVFLLDGLELTSERRRRTDSSQGTNRSEFFVFRTLDRRRAKVVGLVSLTLYARERNICQLIRRSGNHQTFFIP